VEGSEQAGLLQELQQFSSSLGSIERFPQGEEEGRFEGFGVGSQGACGLAQQPELKQWIAIQRIPEDLLGCSRVRHWGGCGQRGDPRGSGAAIMGNGGAAEMELGAQRAAQ
jgi:hypothetical protein